MSTDVLLGPITDPLLPSQSCTIKDISEDADSFISACLCETDYCNAVVKSGLPLGEPPGGRSLSASRDSPAHRDLSSPSRL